MRPLTRLQSLGVAVGVVLLALLVGGAAVIWTGYYNVSARVDHFSITTRVLKIVRDQSIAAHSGRVAAPDLTDMDRVRLGAAHYVEGCQQCHGVPGDKRSPVVQAMLPEPPDLTNVAARYSQDELFWIVKNGLKYTGMPAWPAEGRDDEVWHIVAFLLHLRMQGAENYRSLAGLGEADETSNGDILANCQRCHGAEGRAPLSEFVPRLDILPQATVERALREYRDGNRPSGIMQPLAYDLSDGSIRTLAEGLSEQAVPAFSTAGRSGRRGAEIAARGVPESDVPGCLTCHGIGRNPIFPTLSGQSSDYLRQQLELWMSGGRAKTGYGALMSVVAKRLTPEQMHDVADFFQTIPPRTSTGGATE